MNSQELRALQEAYNSVYSSQEEVDQLDEAMSSYDRNRQRAAQRAAERNEARKQGKTGNVPGVGYVSPRPERETYRDSAGTERHKTGARMPKKEDQKESFDLYDIILSHLLDEGYAETSEAAEAIMVNMSEEWKQNIVEAGENIGREPKTVGGRERSGVPGETYAERQQRMKPKPVKEARYYGGRRGPDRNAVGGADRDDSPRYRNLGSPTPRQAAQEQDRADAAAERAVAQSRRRRRVERGQNNG